MNLSLTLAGAGFWEERKIFAFPSLAQINLRFSKILFSERLIISRNHVPPAITFTKTPRSNLYLFFFIRTCIIFDIFSCKYLLFYRREMFIPQTNMSYYEVYYFKICACQRNAKILLFFEISTQFLICLPESRLFR